MNCPYQRIALVVDGEVLLWLDFSGVRMEPYLVFVGWALPTIKVWGYSILVNIYTPIL
jgi:hypothetical protein